MEVQRMSKKQVVINLSRKIRSVKALSDYLTARISKTILINYQCIEFKFLIQDRTLEIPPSFKKTNLALLTKAMVIEIIVRAHNIILIVFWEIVNQERPMAAHTMMGGKTRWNL